MSGKGSRPRPYSVSQTQFEKNWDNIFSKSKLEDRMQSEADLFSITNKDWYLTAINPWYKMFWNAKTGEHKQIPYK